MRKWDTAQCNIKNGCHYTRALFYLTTRTTLLSGRLNVTAGTTEIAVIPASHVPGIHTFRYVLLRVTLCFHSPHLTKVKETFYFGSKTRVTSKKKRFFLIARRVDGK